MYEKIMIKFEAIFYVTNEILNILNLISFLYFYIYFFLIKVQAFVNILKLNFILRLKRN